MYLLRSVDLPELWRQLGRTHWGWALAAVVAAPLGVWVRARRWHWLFPPRSEPPSLVPANMIGYMANNVLPLRAGEVVRVYVVSRRWRAGGGTHGFWVVLATVIVERVLDSLAIVLVLAALVLLIEVPPALEYAAVLLLLVDLAAVGALGALSVAPERTARLLARLTARWPALARLAQRGFDTFLRGLEGVRTPAHLPPLLAWTVLVWLLPAFGAWAMLRAVHADLPFVAGWAVVAFVGIGISIPSAPGYVGVWHAAAVLAVTLFGVDRPTAIGYALLYHASAIVPITLVGWMYLVREHMTLGEAVAAAPPAPPDAPRPVP